MVFSRLQLSSKEYLKSVGVDEIMDIPNNMMSDYIEKSKAKLEKLDIIVVEDKIYGRYIESIDTGKE